jgi:DNA polymerase-1
VACEDPNLLAFPSRDELGRRVRDCFVPRPGMTFISVDFSQLEPRIVAALSKDERLLHIYANNLDIYVDARDRLSITRQEAKVVTLGVLYGMTDRRLFEQLTLAANGSGGRWDLDACALLIKRWFEAYPGVKELVARTLAAARAQGGWVYTYHGRGRYLPALFLEGNRWPASKLREEAERQGFNHVIQGSGAEQTKLAQLRVAKQFPEVYPLLQMHDELVVEAPEDRADELAVRTAAAMATVFLGVTLKTEAKVGRSWGLLKG